MRKTLILLGFLMVIKPAAGLAQAYIPASPPSESTNIEPTDYRRQVLAAMRAALREPSSVKEAMISRPLLAWMGVARRYVVCVRYNAKNGFGGYTGQTEAMAIFVGGKFSSFRSSSAGECRGATYHPFTEALNLR